MFYNLVNCVLFQILKDEFKHDIQIRFTNGRTNFYLNKIKLAIVITDQYLPKNIEEKIHDFYKKIGETSIIVDDIYLDHYKNSVNIKDFILKRCSEIKEKV